MIGFNKDNGETERFCRNGEEIGDKYACTYGCPVNLQGQGICSKVMMMIYPIMEAVRSGGNLLNVGGEQAIVKCYTSKYRKRGNSEKITIFAHARVHLPFPKVLIFKRLR